MSLITNFPLRADIYAPAETATATGGTAQVWGSAVYTGVPCRLQAKNSTEAFKAGRMAESQYAVMFCPARRGSRKISILQKYRVKISNDRSRSWEVLGSRDPDTQHRFQVVELEERK